MLSLQQAVASYFNALAIYEETLGTTRMDNRSSLIHHSHHGHPNKGKKRLSIYIFLRIRARASTTPPLTLHEYYNFLKFNSTSQKAQGIRKKA